MILNKQNILLIFLILVFTSASFCQSENYDYSYVAQPFSKYFSPKEYNASASNWCIAQDKRGIMYFGNSQGLLEYDGTSWRKIKIPFSALVRTIATDDNGKIFITASSDFGYLEPDSIGQLKFIPLRKQLDKVRKIEKEFWDVAVNSKGVFFKTPDEIIRWDGKEFKIWDSVYAYRLYKIGDEIYSRNQGKGLMKIDGDSIYVIPDGEFFSDTGVFDMLPLAESDKNHPSKILITTNYSGLFIYDEKKNVSFKTEIDEFLFKNQVYNTCILNNGNIALATQRGGVAIIDTKGKLVRFLNQNSGLPTNVAYDVYPDKLGGLWIATNEGIVFSETNSPLSFIPAEGQLRSQITSIIRYENKIYVANDIGVLVLNEGKSEFEILKGSNKPAYQLFKLNGKSFAATNWGLKIIRGNEFVSDLDLESISLITPSSLFPDLFYYGSTGYLGIVKSEINKQPSVKTVDLTKDEVGSVFEDSDSTLWINQYDRPILHVTSKMKGFETVLGNDSIQMDNYSDVNRLPGSSWQLFSFKKRFLLATDKGIYRFDNRSKSFISDSILGAEFTTSDYFVSIIEKSNKGGYWILAGVKKHFQLGKALLQKNGNYKWEPMPLFPRMDINDVNAIYPDYDPRNDKEILWISTSEGIVYYDPDKEKDLNIPFSVHIRKAIVNNDSLVYAGSKTISGSYPNAVIPFSQNDIRFEFSASSYEKSSANQYQYYLEGSDDSWSAWTTEIKKDYTNLSVGDYKFHIRAKNVYGMLSREDTFSFLILPPWYKMWWAYILYVLVFAGGILAVDRVQRQRLLKKERERAENERKTKELEKARELQLSMLPKIIPALSYLDIATYTRTATEVGGDYYDFYKSEENRSIVTVLGDATGHGLNAGMMVGITKGLFQSLVNENDLKNVISHFNSALISMNLQPMYLSITFLKIIDKQLRIVGAGMPPSLYYEAINDSVFEIESGGPPLGGFPDYDFKIYERELSAGDIIVLMSDGFGERRNSDKKIFGWDNGKKLLTNHSGLNSNQIINEFVKTSDEWGGERPQDDDMTFVVIKVK